MKKRIMAWLMAAAVAVSGLLIPGEVRASSQLVQPGIYNDKIVINIVPELGEHETIDKMYVYLQKNDENFVLKKTLDGSERTFELTDLSPSNSYDVRVNYDYTYHGTYQNYKYEGSTLATIYDAKMLPKKVTGLKLEEWYMAIKSIYVKWNRQAIDGYQYQLYNAKNKKIRTGILGNYYENEANFKKLGYQTYKIRVRGYTEFNGSRHYGPWSAYSYLVPNSPSVKAKFSRRKLNLKWKAVPGATSYSILVSTKYNTGYKVVKTVSAKKKKAVIAKFGKKKFKKNTWYYVVIRANKKTGGKTWKSKVSSTSSYEMARCR